MNDEDLAATILRNAFDLWFEPEIKRRQQAGLLPVPATIRAVQVLLEPEAPLQIRLNQELKGVFKAPLPSEAVNTAIIGGELSLADLGEIDGMQLTIEEANAGHLTAIEQMGRWHLMFDFRYNATRVEHQLNIARQFLDAAQFCFGKGHHNAAVDTLFAAVETLSKSYLLVHPDVRLLKKSGHGLVHSEFNRYGKRGNVLSEFVVLFNKLTDLRPKARYPDTPLRLDDEDISAWIECTKRMLADIESRRPTRYRGKKGKVLL